MPATAQPRQIVHVLTGSFQLLRVKNQPRVKKLLFYQATVHKSVRFGVNAHTAARLQDQVRENEPQGYVPCARSTVAWPLTLSNPVGRPGSDDVLRACASPGNALSTMHYARPRK